MNDKLELLARLVEALKFYADPFVWKKKHDPDDAVSVPDFYSETSFGDIATEALMASPPAALSGEDDCEDQGLCPTDVCLSFKCQSWAGDTLIRPSLELRGKHWCCPKCHTSYGEHAKELIVNPAASN